MVWAEKPKIIAVDNVHELAADRRDLVFFLHKLPSDTKLSR